APRAALGILCAATQAAVTAPATVSTCKKSPTRGCTLSCPHDPQVTIGETTLREKFFTMLLMTPR
ncbi:MAG TPA: hypothetical protein VIF62_26360, partial [Labilithrix sp.]